jgi:hypothetical protein
MIEPKPEMWPAANEAGAVPVPPLEGPGAAAAATTGEQQRRGGELEKEMARREGGRESKQGAWRLSWAGGSRVDPWSTS